MLQISDSGLFNNVNLHDLWRSVMWVHGHQVVTAAHEYMNIQFSDVSVRGTVNGLQIPGPDVVLVNQNVTITAEKVFLADCSARELHVNVALNGIRHIPDPASDWKGQLDMLVKTPIQRITGTWTFKGKVVFEDKVTVTGLVNDRKLDDLYRYALRIDAPVFPNFKKVVFANNVQAVRAPKFFMRNLHVKNLVVEETINGVTIADFCRLDENCLITAPKDFETLTVDGGLTANNFIVRNRINGVRAAELLQDSMLYSAHQVVSGRKIFAGNLTVPRHANVRTSNFSGVSLGELYLDAVQLRGNQVITGEKVFSTTITAPRFEFETLLDGVSQEDISNWMLQGVDQVISGDMVFENSLEALGPLIVRGTINEVNIQELFSKTAFKNESTTFAGPVRFEFLGSMADVHVSGTVQGIDISEEVVDATKNVTLSGRKFMKKGFNVDGNMWVSGLVDSVKVEELCKKALTASGNQFVAPTTVLGDVTFHRGVKVDGLVDGVDLRELHSSCAKTNVPATLRGSKRFRNIVIEGACLFSFFFQPVTLRGTLNGFNFDYLKDHYMSVSRDQIVETKLKMHAAHIHGSLHCASVETPLVNGLSLPLFVSSALRTVGDQTLSVPCKFHNAVFSGDVTVNGNVNGLQLPLDVFTKVRTNVVSGTLTVTGNATIAGTLTMPESARLQGVDVAAWAKIAVFNDGREYRISGAKALRNVHTGNANVQGTVDGIKVSSSELLTTSKEQVITGKKTVLGNAAVHDLRVTGYLNGVNIHEFVHQAMLKSRNNTVTAPKRFTSGLSIATLHTTGHIGNVSLRELKQSIRSVGELEALTRQLGQHTNRIKELGAAFQEQAVLLAYYEQIFAFTVGPSYSALYAPLRDSSEIFVISSPAFRHQPCGILKTFKLQVPYTRALPVQEAIAQGSSLHLLSTQAADYIIVVNANADPLCSKEVPILGVHGVGYSSVEIFRWNPGTKSLNLYQVFRMNALRSVSPFNYEALGCLAVSAAGYLKIACVHDTSKGFVVHQNLPMHYSHEVSAHLCPKDGSVLIAVSAKQPGQFDRVFSYRWSRRGLQKMASIAAVSVGSVAVLGHPDACLVVVGQRSVAGADTPTSVYSYVPGRHQEMLEVQKLFAGDVQSISWLPSPDGRTSLMFVRSSGAGKNLKVYAFKGASGFLEQESLHVDESFREVRTFRRPDGLHFVTLSNSRDEPSAVILASKVKGTPYSHL
ncbi:hypothetical protein HPB49_024481 [Dermacentor silvarum]|uniref:Uncharacterized protein n=1 Tax=Dermacentor silvarum TaxID=543639 RepID=A0ACB8D110_DERSI|nr:hypothetical protein HPB49_024481 [Dermacentor silvarum]